MISALISRLFILLFGTLYPAYSSYKAVRTKNVKEYVKWMMYWVVFAFFTTIETFTDIFLSWFPFYYEAKIIIVVWLLSPVTKGSSTLYRKFVHPMLTRREHEIDEYLNQVKERGYSAVLQLGSKGVNYATNVIMQTAIKYNLFGFDASRSILPPPESNNRIGTGIDEHDGGAYRSPASFNTMDVEFSEDDDYQHLIVTEVTVEEDEAMSAAMPHDNIGDNIAGTTTTTTAARTRGIRKPKNTAAGGSRILRRRRLREPSQASDVVIE